MIARARRSGVAFTVGVVAAGLMAAAIFALAHVPAADAQSPSIFQRTPDGGALDRMPRAGGAVDAGANADPPVRGSLDKEIIRRVIRGHIAAVRRCYDKELLVHDPLGAGTIMMQFMIAATGHVIAAKQTESTVPDRGLGVSDCIGIDMMTWEFPKPLGGGSVIVSYPFTFKPGETRVIATGPSAKEEVAVGGIDGSFFWYRAVNADGIPANGLVARTPAGLLLIDAGWSDAQVESVLAWGDARFKQPWIGAVLTHDHADRDGGVGALLRRKIAVGALDLTAQRLAKRQITGVSSLLSAAARERAFADPRGFELFYPGAGHARDNLVVWFPGARLLVGGCLIKARAATDLGFTGDADLGAWPASVRRVAERYPTPALVIPGHGDLLSEDPYARTLALLAPR